MKNELKIRIATPDDAAALLAWCDKILAQAKLQMEEIDARMPHTVQANEDEE